MGKITILCATTLTKEQFLNSITDFGPERGKVWPNSQPKYLNVHSLDNDSADVTEGSDIFGGVWERLHYDWSNQDKIIITTTDSNFWKSGSKWEYDFITSDTNENMVIRYTVTRSPKTAKAFSAMMLVGAVGKIVLTKQFRKTLLAIEGAHYQ